MSAPHAALQKALECLRTVVELDADHGVAIASSSSASSTGTQEALASLKRIKHALIGNTSRKLELVSRPDDLQR